MKAILPSLAHCHKKVRQTLPVLLFNMWFSGYLLAAASTSDIMEGNSAPAIFLQETEDDVQPTIEWDKTLGGNLIDNFNTIISTSDGNYLLGGVSHSDASGDKSENSKGGGDFWIVKIDANGNKIWDKTIGGNSPDLLNSIISTSDGGYLLCGYSSSDASGDKSENNKGASDFWVVKIDANGNKIWDKTIGGSGVESFNFGDVISAPDGGYLLIGNSSSDASGDKSENSKGGVDFWIVKIDANGNKIWDKTIGGSGDESFGDVISMPDGGYMLVGNSSSNASGDKSENSKGLDDFWVVKIDANGNKIWDKTIGGSKNDAGNKIILTTDGNYLLAGSSLSDASGDKSENNKGGSDFWVVKIDADGNKIWDKTIGGSNSDGLYDALLTTDGGYLLAGDSYSDASGDKSENSKGWNDYWIVKVDAQGNKLWDKTIGGSNSDYLKDILLTTEGDYLLAGTSSSPLSGDKSEGIKGVTDFWIVKIKEQDTPIVRSFVLIDAKMDKEVGELNNEDEIYPGVIDGSWLNIRANASGPIDHVQFELTGPVTHYQIERTPPYALFGDDPSGDYKGRKWLSGNYTLTATPFGNGEEGTALTISFEIIDTFSITSFTLIDAESDQNVGALSEGDVIDLASTGNHQFTISATIDDAIPVSRVIFTLEGPVATTQKEREPPYALFGDFPTGNFKGRKLLPGNYTLTVIPYIHTSKGTTSTINFVVINSNSAPSLEKNLSQTAVYPMPTSGMINILHEGKSEGTQLKLLDFGGNVLLQQPMHQQSVEQMDLSGFRKGIYYLKIVSPKTVEVFRVVVE